MKATTPPKAHNFVAIASFPITPYEALLASKGHFVKKLGQKDISNFQIGCYDCELELKTAIKVPCKGKP